MCMLNPSVPIGPCFSVLMQHQQRIKSSSPALIFASAFPFHCCSDVFYTHFLHYDTHTRQSVARVQRERWVLGSKEKAVFCGVWIKTPALFSTRKELLFVVFSFLLLNALMRQRSFQLGVSAKARVASSLLYLCLSICPLHQLLCCLSLCVCCFIRK